MYYYTNLFRPMKELSELTNAQKQIVIAFWYDAEMNNGGHSGYLDCHPNIQTEKLILALTEIGAYDFVENFRNAMLFGKDDDYVETDKIFGSYDPSLTELLQRYVVLHAEKIGLTLD